MKKKVSIIYTWFVRISTMLLPDIPVFMRFRGMLYSLMMQRCGRNLQVASTAILNPLSGLVIGNNVRLGHRTSLVGLGIEIGDEVIVGVNSVISGGNHTFYKTSYRRGKHFTKPVKIGSGSWIAANCSVTGGAVLPERSVLASGAVLTKAYTEADCIYAGVPAVLIKKIVREDFEIL